MPWMKDTLVVRITRRVLKKKKKFFLFQFETRQIEKCLDYIYKTAMQGVQSSQLCQQVYVTGGGAYKYSGTYLVYATLSYSASQEAHL